jgi:hypothetical protein
VALFFIVLFAVGDDGIEAMIELIEDGRTWVTGVQVIFLCE